MRAASRLLPLCAAPAAAQYFLSSLPWCIGTNRTVPSAAECDFAAGQLGLPAAHNAIDIDGAEVACVQWRIPNGSAYCGNFRLSEDPGSFVPWSPDMCPTQGPVCFNGSESGAAPLGCMTPQWKNASDRYDLREVSGRRLRYNPQSRVRLHFYVGGFLGDQLDISNNTGEVLYTAAPGCFWDRAHSGLWFNPGNESTYMDLRHWVSVCGSAHPTAAPSGPPLSAPSTAPSAAPSPSPSAVPTVQPSVPPTDPPTRAPSRAPSGRPTAAPTRDPSTSPPSLSPTLGPSAAAPSLAPSSPPSPAPSAVPTLAPTAPLSAGPSVGPSRAPTQPPSRAPSAGPTAAPLVAPSVPPSGAPSLGPTTQTSQPTIQPWRPAPSPSAHPTSEPSRQPSPRPTQLPSEQPPPSGSPAPGSNATVAPAASTVVAPSAPPANVTAPGALPTAAPAAGAARNASSAPPTAGPSYRRGDNDGRAPPAAEATAEAAQAVAVFSLSPGSAAQAGRLGAVLGGCTPGVAPDELPLSLPLHPTKVSLGFSAMPRHAGCIVMNTVIAGGVLLLAAVASYALSAAAQRSHTHAQALLRFPSFPLIVCCALSQGAALSGARIITHSSVAADWVLGLSAITGSFLLPCVLYRQGLKAQQLCVWKFDCQSARSTVIRMFSGPGDWLNLPRESAVLERWGGTFRSALPGKHAVLALDLFLGQVAMVSEGIGGKAECSVCTRRRVVDVVVATGFTLLLTYQRPYVRLLRLPLIAIHQVLLAAAAAVLAAEHAAGHCGDNAAAGLLLMLSAAAQLMANCVDAGATLRSAATGRKNRLYRSLGALQQQCADGTDMVPVPAVQRWFEGETGGHAKSLSGHALFFCTEALPLRTVLHHEEDLWKSMLDEPAELLLLPSSPRSPLSPSAPINDNSSAFPKRISTAASDQQPVSPLSDDWWRNPSSPVRVPTAALDATLSSTMSPRLSVRRSVALSRSSTRTGSPRSPARCTSMHDHGHNSIFSSSSKDSTYQRLPQLLSQDEPLSGPAFSSRPPTRTGTGISARERSPLRRTRLRQAPPSPSRSTTARSGVAQLSASTRADPARRRSRAANKDNFAATMNPRRSAHWIDQDTV
eukprot:TRINITY_DN15083_c0_g1_i1.p1 TRINITY_DN15083_c0_g1~~TRINITY_DN15083_c0_g1_i1.p1  ORF type:complete len:1131 (+),score=160.05 TRINITY_DN15083_c0_g1_i1:82-3393(+)